jgi:hypothetical protein
MPITPVRTGRRIQTDNTDFPRIYGTNGADPDSDDVKDLSDTREFVDSLACRPGPREVDTRRIPPDAPP